MTRLARQALSSTVVVLALSLVSVGEASSAGCSREYLYGLTLVGTQELVVTDGTLCVHGDITLRDNARLLMADATLRISGFTRKSLWGSWVYVDLQDNAQLEMRNVRVEVEDTATGDRWIWIRSMNASRVHLNGVTNVGQNVLWVDGSGESNVVVEGTVLGKVWAADHTTVRIADSTVQDSVTLTYRGPGSVELSSLRPGLVQRWETLGGTGSAPRLLVENTRVGWWWLIVDAMRVAVRDSFIRMVSYDLGTTVDQVEGMRPGYYSSWSVGNLTSGDASGGLTLTRSTVENWAIGVSYRTRPLTIRNSTLIGLGTHSSSMRLRVENVVTLTFTPGHGNIILECASFTVLDGIQLDSVRVDISGDLTFRSGQPRAVWTTSSVVRDYEVRVRDRAGQPARGVQVQLEDPSGAVTAHTTDQDGILRFTIRFDDTSYERAWTLLVHQGDTTAKVPAGLLTSTPLDISVGQSR